MAGDFDDTRPIPIVDEDGNPMTLREALRRRDALLAKIREETREVETGRRHDVTTIEAAKRLGRLQARLALYDRRSPA